MQRSLAAQPRGPVAPDSSPTGGAARRRAWHGAGPEACTVARLDVRRSPPVENLWTARSPARRAAICLSAASAPETREGPAAAQQQRQQHQHAFKYARLPCSSPCMPGDARCEQMEAVVQHVLRYPRMPTRVCRWLPSIQSDVATMTHSVEGLSRRYGQELTLHFLRRAPQLLNHELDTLLARADHVRVMLDLKGPDVLQVLRKNPHLFCMEAQVARARYNALHKILHLSHDNIKALVRKFPLLLNYQTATVEEIVDSLRQVCSMRMHWQEDFENITPSTLAYFIRDHNDLMDRLEFLVATGGAPFTKLPDIFKMTTSLFKRKHAQFKPWLQAREIGEARRRARQLQQSGSAAPAVGGGAPPRERRTRSALAAHAAAASRATP